MFFIGRTTKVRALSPLSRPSSIFSFYEQKICLVALYMILFLYFFFYFYPFYSGFGYFQFSLLIHLSQQAVENKVRKVSTNKQKVAKKEKNICFRFTSQYLNQSLTHDCYFIIEKVLTRIEFLKT